MELVWTVLLALGAGCAALPPQTDPQGTVAMVYYWKAKEGKMEEYNRYIREVAEPIDAEGRRHGAFLSVTTFVSQKPDGPWTHMRIFVLKDHSQLKGLSAALDAAGVRLEPDETKRRVRSEYAATLRDFVGREVLDVLR
jgi:hypothetical protein